MRNSIDVKGAVVVVTGVTSGIGRGVASVLARRGAHVVGNGRRADRGNELADELAGAAGSFHFLAGDMTRRPDADALVTTALALHGRLDVMINNAGTVGERPLRPFAEIDDDFWRMIVDTNLTTMFLGCQAALPALQRSKGAIINVGSGAGASVGADLLAYRAAKAAAMHLSRSLALTVATSGVRVHTLVMHSVESEGGERVMEHRAESLTADEAAEMRAGRAAVAVLPEDVGAGIVDLLADASTPSGPGYTVV
jgi:NAD(P)-dependent dehydrogenase (short-subunit alcohol dehydrogenase family)